MVYISFCLVNQSETATVDNVSVRNNQIVINGTVNYQMLYYGADDGRVNVVRRGNSFEEIVKAQDIDEDGNATKLMVIVSSSVKMIDNRSYIYKIQIMAYVTVETTKGWGNTYSIRRLNNEK